MTSVPARPVTTSSQRTALTAWCSHRAATTVTHSGTVATMAVNSANGRAVRLMKPNRLVMANSAPRKAWKRGCVVRRAGRPARCSTKAVVSSDWNT
ncbi:hypothetical protein D3C72_2006110 [compost metagenome]